MWGVCALESLWGVYRGGMRGLRAGNTGGMGVVWPVAVWGVWGGVWVGGGGGCEEVWGVMMQGSERGREVWGYTVVCGGELGVPGGVQYEGMCWGEVFFSILR